MTQPMFSGSITPAQAFTSSPLQLAKKKIGILLEKLCITTINEEMTGLVMNNPKVADVAVIGVPNEDFGEEVKAVVQPAKWTDVGPELEAELIQFCKDNLSAIKCPRSVDFDKELPRHPTGKLYKRLVRDRYWGNKDSKIV